MWRWLGHLPPGGIGSCHPIGAPPRACSSTAHVTTPWALAWYRLHLQEGCAWQGSWGKGHTWASRCFEC